MPRPATIVDPETLPLGGERWDWLLAGLLGALLIFLPASFGAVEAWSRLLAFAASGVLLVALLLRLIFDRTFHLARTWLYFPLLAIVLFTALQAVPLPAGLIHILSPTSLAIRQELLGNSFTATQTSISLYPYATSAFVRLFLMGLAVFVTVSSLVRTSRQFKLLLAAIFVIGCAEAFLALAQIATGTGSIYWTIPVSGGTTTAGTFVNYSNFSQFMNLSMGAGLALLLVRLAEQHRDSSADRFWRGAVRSYWEHNSLLCVGLAMCALAILASLSRNGAIAMLVASAVVGLTLLKRSSLNLRGWILAAIPTIVLISLFVYGFDLVYARLATLQDSNAHDLRWEMMRAAYRAWQQFPVCGTGFGTHEMVASQYEHAMTAALAGHADNDYAQLLEETGIIGVILVAALVLGVSAVVARLVLWGRKPSALAAYGILYALVAVAVQSATDFGQRLPANLILTATLSGLAVALARIEFRSTAAKAHRRPPTRATWQQPAFAVAAVLLVLLVWSWGLRAAYAAYLGERWWAAAVTLDDWMHKNTTSATNEDFTNLLTAAEGAFASDPANVQYGYWLNEYRWEAVSRLLPAGTATFPADSLPIVRRIAEELANLRPAAPTFGPPYALEGQLRLFVLREPTGSDLIKKGVRLANYDPPTCLVAGELAAREGRRAEAESLLNRALTLQPTYFPEIVDFSIQELNDIGLAKKLAGGDHGRLSVLAAAVEQSGKFAAQAAELRADAEQALRAIAKSDTANPDQLVNLARIEQQRQNLPAAIELYRRALSREYQRFDWRLQLAEMLAAVGQTEDAIHELKIALRLRPRDSAATKLLGELVTQRNPQPK